MATEVAPLELGEAAMVPGGALGRPIRGTARELWGGQAVETGAVVFSLPTRRRVTASEGQTWQTPFLGIGGVWGGVHPLAR